MSDQTEDDVNDEREPDDNGGPTTRIHIPQVKRHDRRRLVAHVAGSGDNGGTR